MSHTGPRYIVHDSPVGRSSQNHIAMVDLAPFGFPDSMEQMWLVPLSDGRHRIACIPFRAYGLALGDTVILDSEGRRVVRLVGRSGHRVFRILFAPTSQPVQVPVLARSVEAAASTGALRYEWSGDRHIAIDVPPGGDAGPVWQVIQAAARAREASWEWADIEEFRT